LFVNKIVLNVKVTST